MDFLLIYSITSDSLLTGSNIYTHHKTPSAEAYWGRSNWTGKKTMFNHFSFLPHKQVSQLSLVTQSTSQTPSGTQWHHLNYINSHVKCCRFRSLSHCSVANLQRFCCVSDVVSGAFLACPPVKNRHVTQKRNLRVQKLHQNRNGNRTTLK